MKVRDIALARSGDKGNRATLSVIAYDPNIRTNVEPDLDVWRATLQWMLPRTHLLKVSDEDLGLLLPGRSIDQFAADALAAGTPLVVVTRGAEGAVGYTRQGRVTAPPVAVQVADTVGAGDTFQAAILAWLAEHDALSAEALDALDVPRMAALLRFAARAASITCSRRGADMPRRGELD